ncbi:putative oxidoreductase GLYR1 homolog [Trichonephila inaurata madagascariensis]|uniref:Cytokine-like nuclear factor N-PAC n=1 Tax=Trichonephila inaurata madagascariensis TaxID=2747483 RepID=A0A8X6XYV5_9ARAC|nr:putative oxidoreductase GLYR1 homolog [Trichonephila inaurata madagascariensis]
MMVPKDFEIGDLVWAKRKNFPFWPGKIADPPTVLEEDQSSTRRKAQHYVFFFGSQNHAWVWDKNIVPHSVEMLPNVTSQKSNLFVKAIDEIIAAGGVSVPNLKLVKKEPVSNSESNQNLIDGEFVESTKQKIKVEKTEEPVEEEDVIVVFVRRSVRLMQKIKVEKKEEPSENDTTKKTNPEITTKNPENITKTPTIKDDKLFEDSPSVVYVKMIIKNKKKIKHGKKKKLIETENKSTAIGNQEKIIKTPSVKDDEILKKSPVVDFVKENTSPKQRSNSGETKEPVQDDKSTKISTPAWYSKKSSISDEELLLISPAVRLNKREKTKFIEDRESSKSFSAVKSRGQTINIPSVADDKFTKKSTVLSIKKSRTPKEIACEKTKKPPQKRNLTEEASYMKLSPVRKLSLKSDDNSASIFNTPRNNTYNPVGVYRPLDDRSMIGQKYVEPSPVPVLDMSRANPIVKASTTTKEITCEKTKKPPQKRDLTEEASYTKLSPVRKLSRKSDDNSASIFNTPHNNTYNPIGQKYVEPSPVPVLDMSRANPILRRKNIRATSKKIGFIGLGTMGQRIVKNLLESGHDVSIWNRTQEKCTQFVEAGAHKFSTPCDVVLHCDIIFCCVSGPEAMNAIVFGNRGILQGLQKHKPGTKGLVLLSALDLKTAQKIAEAIKSNGGIYLEAPIRGSIPNAEEGSLLLVASGNHELYDDCSSCFKAISRNSRYLDHNAGSASIMHMCIRNFYGIINVALAEEMSLLESMNLSNNQFLKCLELGSHMYPLFREKGLAMATKNFTTNHSLKYQQSDLQMLLQTCEALSQPAALASAANEVYKKAKRFQYADHDMSAVYLATKEKTNKN